MNTRAVGNFGENIAVKYLRKNGYKILERNFVSQHGEIDIVAKDGAYYVFVEVKRRKTEQYGLPREAVDFHKQQTILQCAKHWLVLNKIFGVPVRFDVVEVYDDKPVLWKDAFR